MLELTTDNYYSIEADRDYMSCSQYQSFLECEAATMARLRGDYVPAKSEALIVGNYFHTAFESDEAHEKFCEENFQDIFKTKTVRATGELVPTGKYAPYVQADEMILTCMNDPLMKKFILMHGENEKILSGELFGMPWKIRLDKYIPDKRIIIDYKTTANIGETKYNPKTGQQETFLEIWGYLMRAAVYTEIEKQYAHSDEDAKFIILAVSKQSPPDKGAFLLNHRQRYDYELDEIKKNMAHIRQVKSGALKPLRCGRCEYCRKTKVLKKVVPYYTLNPAFREEKEEEYDAIYSANMEDAQET